MATETKIDNDLEIAWPKTGDKLFEEVHTLRGATAAHDAEERQYRLNLGYQRGADLLVEHAEMRPHERADLLYPIVFCYRQALELRLKDLLITYGPDANETPDFKNHGLEDLWTKWKRVLTNLGYDPVLSEPDARVTETHIKEFAKVDPGSFNFRYAFKTDGNPIERTIGSIDLSRLRTIMAGILNYLECTDMELHHRRHDW